MLFRQLRSLLLVGLLLCTATPAQLVPAPKATVTALHTTVKNIHCAVDPLSAGLHLRELQQHRLLSPGLPNEAHDGKSPELRATTLDKILQILNESAKKFPQNKPLVEQAVIRWNFCSVIDNGTLYDHRVKNGKTEKYPSALAENHHWSGFKQFGLMPDSDQADIFDFTTPYIDSTIKSLADRELKQRYIDYCLPHPDNEHRYRDAGRNFISRILLPAEKPSPLVETDWLLECPVDAPVLTDNIQTTDEFHSDLAINTQAEIETSAEAPLIAAALTPPGNQPDNPSLAPANKVNTQHIREPAPIPEPSTNTLTQRPEQTVPTSVVVPIPNIDAALVDASDLANPRQRATTGPGSGPESGAGRASTGKKTLAGLSGSIAVNNSGFLSRNTNINFAVSYTPVKDSYWFIRTGATLSQKSDPLTYSWGIGYDDWHPGTWAVQLNHWGPLKPGDGLDIKNSAAEVSYKFKKNWLENRNLTSSISLTKPLSSDPVIKWGWAWNPHSHWFIRSTLSKPVGESGLNWTYGFDYSRYNHNSLSLEYNNWGPNEFPDLNFKRNALISLI